MSRDTSCEPCRGTGEVGHYRGPESDHEQCHACGGEGYVIWCDRCHDVLEPDHERASIFPGVDLCDACDEELRECVAWSSVRRAS